MASASKVSSSGSKTAARSVSQTRLVATKGGKKASTPPKARESVSPPAAAKTKGASIPPTANGAAAAADARSRGGASKNELKAQFAKLAAASSQIAGLKRSLHKTFFEVGLLLNQIRTERLYEVKGYGSFESFVEREIDINKATCLRVARISEALIRDQAIAAGLDRATAAVAALDGESEPAAVVRPAGSPAGGVPLHKQ